MKLEQEKFAKEKQSRSFLNETAFQSPKSRRKFLRDMLEKGALLCSLPLTSPFLSAQPDAEQIEDLIDGKHIFVKKEASYYKKLPYRKIECQLCPKKCNIDDQERGFCGNRENQAGTYYTLVHSNPCAVHIDPIEKKPLFHFLPGTDAYSIATAGCNFVCKFCQNWQISQFRPEQTDNVYLPPKRVVQLARQNNCTSIAYTYSEPVVFYEYMFDTSVEAQNKGIKTVMISNGYINLDPMRELCKHLNAVKIDFKAYTEKFFKEICQGSLKPVLDVLELLRDLGIWYEMVYLVIPSLNDSQQEIKKMSIWIRETLGKDVPLHFSRFYPQYRLKNLPPTPVPTLEMARDTALAEGLNYVYIGNVTGHPGENTYCPECKNVVIRRTGYIIIEINLNKGKCKFCGKKIPGVWS